MSLYRFAAEIKFEPRALVNSHLALNGRHIVLSGFRLRLQDGDLLLRLEIGSSGICSFLFRSDANRSVCPAASLNCP